MIVGIIQLEDLKSQAMLGKRFLKLTLKLAEEILIKAMAKEIDECRISNDSVFKSQE